MFKGSVSPHRWTYKGKKRKAWGIRYRIDGGPLVRKIVADTGEVWLRRQLADLCVPVDPADPDESLLRCLLFVHLVHHLVPEQS